MYKHAIFFHLCTIIPTLAMTLVYIFKKQLFSKYYQLVITCNTVFRNCNMQLSTGIYHHVKLLVSKLTSVQTFISKRAKYNFVCKIMYERCSSSFPWEKLSGNMYFCFVFYSNICSEFAFI